MIEVITAEDIDWLLNISYEFNEIYYDLPLNLKKARKSILDYLELPSVIGFKSKTGYIIGGIEDDPFRDYVVLKEYVWFSKDKSGLELLKAFERHAIICGVNEIRMTTLSSNPTIGKIINRLGYEELETSHTKRIH